jgi:FkbM family methyltransferase
MRTVRHAFVSSLDRPGARWLLSSLATSFAQAKARDRNIAVKFREEVWADVVDDLYFPRAKTFAYYGYDLAHLRSRVSDRISGSIDYWTFAYSPRSGDTIVDLGAGRGIDALALTGVVKDCSYHAIEAHPNTYYFLRKTCALNRLRNVKCYNLAISEKPGTLWMDNQSDDEENSVSDSPTDTHTIAVPALDLDSFLRHQHIDRVDFLKINIEGAELRALKGLSHCMDRVACVAVACHDFVERHTKAETIDLLREKGFHVLERNNDNRAFVRDHVHGIVKSDSRRA